MKPFGRIRRTYRLLKMYKVGGLSRVGSNVQLHNYGPNPAPQDYWIPKFIEYKGLGEGKRISVFSVFGLRTMMRIDRSDVKIFVARENVHRLNWKDYDDVCLGEKSLDLCVGFDYHHEDERYIRFPLWIMWLFPPDVDYDGIKSFCEKVNDPRNSSYDRRFCSFIASHDDVGRKDLCEEISAIGRIDMAGRFMHNCDDLQEVFENDKHEFLKQYRFNLCPENSDCEGYCTEKIFEAISSGCIPIYWGSGNTPEPDVLNHDAVCFVKVGEPNRKSALGKIKTLNENRSLYDGFAQQPRLLPDAPEVIMQYLESFERKLREVINNS